MTVLLIHNIAFLQQKANNGKNNFSRQMVTTQYNTIDNDTAINQSLGRVKTDNQWVALKMNYATRKDNMPVFALTSPLSKIQNKSKAKH